MSFDYESTSKTVKLDAGVLHYHEAGEGPALLLIHGSGPGVTGWANYQGNLEFFARKFRCLVVDLPGYGGSDTVEGDPVGVCVTACIGILDALGIESAHIIGNSLGGIVGGQIAANFPDRVTSFTTIGGIGLNIFSPFPGEGLNLLTAFTEDPTRDRVETWLRSMVYDQSLVTDELIDMRFEQATEPKTFATTKQLYSREAIAAIAKFREENPTMGLQHLASIKAPTLMTWGRDDRVSPMDISLIPMRLVPNCQLHVFPKCGHWAMIERKAEFEALVMAFLCQTEPSMD